MSETAAPTKSWSNRIIDLITPAVLFGTPLLYVFGRIYSEGYWTTIGFPASVMARNTEDYIYFGFVALVSGVSIAAPRLDTTFVWAAPLMSLALIAALAFAIWGLAKLRSRMRPLMARLIDGLRDYFAERRDGLAAIGKASAIMEAATGIVLLLMLGVLLILLPVVLAFSVGKARAQQVHESLEEGVGTRAKVKIRSRSGAVGRIVDCTDDSCVAYTADGYVLAARGEIDWLPIQRHSTTRNQELMK